MSFAIISGACAYADTCYTTYFAAYQFQAPIQGEPCHFLYMWQHGRCGAVANEGAYCSIIQDNSLMNEYVIFNQNSNGDCLDDILYIFESSAGSINVPQLVGGCKEP